MNTYLVPTTEEFGIKYKNITIIYAESEKEAYEKALVQRGLSACHIQNYETKPYETFYEKINISDKFFPISRKNAILKETFKKEGKEYVELINLYDYMYWGDYNA